MRNRKRRVAITGFGMISSLGNDTQEVLRSLQQGKSGVEIVEEWKAMGLKSYVGGTIKDFDLYKAKKSLGGKSRYMDMNALYCAVAAHEAIAMSGLDAAAISSSSMSCIVGNGLSSTDPIVRAGLNVNGHKASITPFDITRSMSSSCSANLAYVFGVQGRSYSISSACTTSLHNIGHSYELIASGLTDMSFTGGGEEVSSTIAALFNGMRSALATLPEGADPATLSRPYDQSRNGFVVSGGGGIVILEAMEHALERGATIYGEIIGYGVSSDGHDIIQPHPEGDGAYRCMKEALESAAIDAGDIEYINTHGTSTVLGDAAEIQAVRRLIGDKTPISSTKALSGHGIGAAGVHELIHCLLMMNNGFLAGSAHIEHLDPEFEGMNILTANIETEANIMMTNNFGFGGTNASMIIKKYN